MWFFKIDNEADYCGTSLKGHVRARFSDIVRVLGEPLSDDDGYKVSGCWTLTDDNGNVVTLYDWKCSNLYDENLPSVEQFRASTNVTTFNVGAHDYGAARRFIEELCLSLDALVE